MWEFLPEIIEILSEIALGISSAYVVSTPKGRTFLATLIFNIVSGGLDVAIPLLDKMAPTFQAITAALVAALNSHGGGLRATLFAPFGALAKEAIDFTQAPLVRGGESTPDNATDRAAAAFASTFANGISSAGVAALFEAAFPEKLNVLNGMAPILAKMAGFDHVAGEVLKPLYENAFSKSLDYHFRSIFKPELPDEADAVTWHSRRLLTEAQLRNIFKYSGLKSEYENAFVQSAYRAVQPRAIATAFVDVPFPRAAVQSMLEFAGIRPADLTIMLDAFEAASTKNVRQQYLTAIETAWERGTLTDAEALDDLTNLNFSAEAKHLVQLTVATRKLEQLAQLYRKSISEGYKYGSITDADYLPALEAIGIAEADARAHYAVDSIVRHGKEALALERAAASAQAVTNRYAVAAARADFKNGILGEVELAARFAAASMPLAAIPFAVEIEVVRKQTRKRFVFGAFVTAGEAVTLREQVAALKEQRLKHLIDDPTAIALLESHNVPARNAKDLVAEWSAQADKTLRPVP